VLFGTSSRKSPSRFASSAGEIKLIPVTFAPGLFRLSTSPILTGSPSTTKTMGVLLVAALAANAEGSLPVVIITFVPMLTKSVANAGRRRYLPCAQRYSIAIDHVPDPQERKTFSIVYAADDPRDTFAEVLFRPYRRPCLSFIQNADISQ